MVRRLLVGLLLLCSVLVAGSGTSLVSNAHAAPVAVKVAAPAATHAQFLDKTRVILHLALAYGVFHRWVYKPWKAGTLSVKHPLTVVKAGAALLFAVHEVKVAYGITSKSSSPTLKAVNSVLHTIVAQFTKVGNLFKSAPSSLSDAQIGSSIGALGNLVDHSNKILNVPDASVIPSNF